MPIESKQPTAPVRPSPNRNTINSAPYKPSRPSFLVTTIIVVLAAITLVSAGSAVYFYLRYQDLSNNPTKIADDANKALVDRVGKLMVLPAGETPTIATVTDLAPFKGQPFFANAKVGDKVIIYSAAKRAILYDPTADKIVEVAPLNTNTNAPPAATTNTPPPAANQNTNK